MPWSRYFIFIGPTADHFFRFLKNLFFFWFLGLRGPSHSHTRILDFKNLCLLLVQALVVASVLLVLRLDTLLVPSRLLPGQPLHLARPLLTCPRPPPSLARLPVNMALVTTMHKMNPPLTDSERKAVEKVIKPSPGFSYEDGDQSPVVSESLRVMFAMRARYRRQECELNEAILMPLRRAHMSRLNLLESIRDCDKKDTAFHRYCFMGYIDGVREHLMRAHFSSLMGDKDALTKLLDKRLSHMRFSPLHYCCAGAVYGRPELDDGANMKFKECIEALCRKGALIDSKDVLGFTPLGIVAGARTSPLSLSLISVLVSLGADPNAKNRLGEPLITEACVSQNGEAFLMLTEAGANLDALDNCGVSVRIKAMHAPGLGKAWVEHRRRKILSEEKCETCGKVGVSKHCSQCRKAYYCSRECQVAAWKAGHKNECGKEVAKEDILDIVVETMTLKKNDPSTTRWVQLLNAIKQRHDTEKDLFTMKVQKLGKSFRLSAMVMELGSPLEPLVMVGEHAIGFLKLNNTGTGRQEHLRLIEFVQKEGESNIAFLLAKWIEPVELEIKGKKKMSNVLRLDLSKALPPAKTLF